ncbi:polymorphic toxin type 15 domain-containing protein [Nocardia sp. alder85J]|uniref:polymorphic toxin type 15 domain-containing protein n=1 Tax=Nocardia sp. alder85J TaxID=2862949 RepID=UPI001CD39F93|nr:polymorphic toxin type 15 domain-containing protein [Nocardia sp. alder85J]MCX4091312.1 polymorphic toxin type 15 domain-containing protein [Nocardia sp. alder85J]
MSAWADMYAALQKRLSQVVSRAGEGAARLVGGPAADLSVATERVVLAEERGLGDAVSELPADAAARKTAVARQSAAGAAEAPDPYPQYAHRDPITKGSHDYPVNTADGNKWEAVHNGSGSAWADDRNNVAVGWDNQDVQRARADGNPLELHFNRGKTTGTQGKDAEYRRQIDRQIDGVNRMTPDEILGNWDTVERGGTAQDVARREDESGVYADELAKALDRDSAELGRATPEEYARARTREHMDAVRALHEPDLAGGGRDWIGVERDGSWSMGDANVNSSLGSQWKRLRAPLRAYAEQLRDAGDGDKLLNVRWSYA